MTGASCSGLWLHPLSGVEWSRSAGDVGRYLRQRIRPSREAVQERADMLRTQLWLQGQDWVRMSHRRRVLSWLTRPVRSEEHTSELQSLMRISYAVFCLKKKKSSTTI